MKFAIINKKNDLYYITISSSFEDGEIIMSEPKITYIDGKIQIEGNLIFTIKESRKKKISKDDVSLLLDVDYFSKSICSDNLFTPYYIKNKLYKLRYSEHAKLILDKYLLIGDTI